MKFKVGDRVRVRAWDDMLREFGMKSNGDIACQFTFTGDMRRFCGKVGTITTARPSNGLYYLAIDGEKYAPADYCFSNDMLEAVERKVVITTDGEKITTASLIDGETTVKTAVAKCSPEDAFNFETGAEIAFGRLFNREQLRKLSARECIAAFETTLALLKEMEARGLK